MARRKNTYACKAATPTSNNMNPVARVKVIKAARKREEEDIA